MKLSFFYRHMPVSQALNEFSELKMNDRLNRFRGTPTHVHLTFSVERGVHSATAEVIAHDGTRLAAKETADDIYQAIDQLTLKLARQLVKHKELYQRDWGAQPEAFASLAANASEAASDAEISYDSEIEPT